VTVILSDSHINLRKLFVGLLILLVGREQCSNDYLAAIVTNYHVEIPNSINRPL